MIFLYSACNSLR